MNKNSLIIVLQLLVILFLMWFLWRPADNDTSAKVAFEPGKSVSEAQYHLLEERLDLLENELLQRNTDYQQLEDRITQLENPSSSSTQDSASTKTSDLDLQPAQSEPDSIDLSTQQKLINQGLSVQTVNMLQKYVDDKRLQRLNLRDQAVREGWQDSNEYVEKMHALGDSGYGLKQEFGEDVYDQYLYATGRPNRVVVREVINGSVAQSAGLQTGDIIVRYADEPIYSMNELREATTKGTSGENILLEFLRDNQSSSVTIVRGPLGISMDFARIEP